MPLSCIIIDDEPNAVNLLEMLIQQCTRWTLRQKCYDALEAVTFLKQETVDFVFLDINMPQLNGMELAALLPNGIKIVFTTAYSEYALESYNFPTIDYLLKPITLHRFLAAQLKIENSFSQPVAADRPVATPQPTPQPTPHSEENYFFLKSGKDLHRLLIDDILYFEGEKEYVRVVTEKESFLIYRRLKDIEEQMVLPFIRVHNSYIINVRQLQKIQDNHIHIGVKRIPISEKYRETFMDIIRTKLF